MNNIEKIENGFTLNDNVYKFKEFELEGVLVKYELLSHEQVHIGTNNGVIMLDLTCTIEGNSFNNIKDFISLLYL